MEKLFVENISTCVVVCRKKHILGENIAINLSTACTHDGFKTRNKILWILKKKTRFSDFFLK